MPDWTKANKKLVEAIVREGETYLQGQLTVATSADQRASVLGGIFAAAGTAIFGALIAGSTGTLSLSIVVAGIVTGGVFLVSAGLCLSTALPVDFYLPGNEPANWYSDVDAETPLSSALGDVAEDTQSRIVNNNKVLKRNAWLFRTGAILGIAAPLLGLLIWAASHLPR